MDNNRIQTIADVFILTGLVILGMISFSVLGILICMPIFNIEFGQIKNILEQTDVANQSLLFKIFNLSATFGAWVVSSLIYLKMRGYKIQSALLLQLPEKPISLLFLPLLFLALIISSSFILQLAQQINWPDFLMKFNSEQNKAMLETMLKMDNLSDFGLNLLFIALAPALFEEIFFRGVLQRMFIFLFKNHHYGIFFTSFLFAAIHLNVEQFIPMLALSSVFGYVCYYSNSLMPGVILHFLNNAFAVFIYYFSEKNPIARQLADDQFSPPIFISIFSIFLVVGLVFYIYKLNQTKTSHE
jgi:membrane protease YdiL (CAAX protease family)